MGIRRRWGKKLKFFESYFVVMCGVYTKILKPLYIFFSVWYTNDIHTQTNYDAHSWCYVACSMLTQAAIYVN